MTTPPPSSRRDRKKAETRSRIVDSAAALFAARGYDATTVEDISESADVSRATVFNYFARKEDIVIEWFARRRATMVEALTAPEARADTAADRLRRAMRLLAGVYEDEPEVGQAMVRAWLRAGGQLLDDYSDAPAIFAATIRQGQRSGDVSSAIDADLAGHVVFDVYLGTLFRWMHDANSRASLANQLLAALELVLPGIGCLPPV